MSKFASKSDHAGGHRPGDRRQDYYVGMHRHVPDNSHGEAVQRFFPFSEAGRGQMASFILQRQNDGWDLIKQTVVTGEYDPRGTPRPNEAWRVVDERSLLVPAEGVVASRRVPEEVLEMLGRPVQKKGLVHGEPGEVF